MAPAVGVGVPDRPPRPGPSLQRYYHQRLCAILDTPAGRPAQSAVMESVWTQREIKFQALVRRYISQIKYGCEEPNCTTPTCLSCQKRVKDKPFRPPTELTARVLAYYLATQDDPTSQFCPHKLVVEPSSLELKGAGLSAGHIRGKDVISPGRCPLSWSVKGPSFARDTSSSDFWAAVEEKKRKKKDRKSLGQNLFDSNAAISFYSRKLTTQEEGLADEQSFDMDADQRNGYTTPPNVSSSHLTSVLMEDLGRFRLDHTCTTALDPAKIPSECHSGLVTSPLDGSTDQALFSLLSNPVKLLQSFHDNEASATWPLSHLSPARLANAFGIWRMGDESLVLDSLWHSAKALFVPPPELLVEKSPRLRASRVVPEDDTAGFNKQSGDQADNKYLNDAEAAHIIVICIHALSSLVRSGVCNSFHWEFTCQLRSVGRYLPLHTSGLASTEFSDSLYSLIDIVDFYEYEPAMRLAERLIRGIAARRCFSELLHNLTGKSGKPRFPLMNLVIKYLAKADEPIYGELRGNTRDEDDPRFSIKLVFFEWLRTVVLKKWDGKAEIHRWSSVGGAIEIIGDFYENRESAAFPSWIFQIPYIAEQLDGTEVPHGYLERSTNPNMLHILSYPFLFPPPVVVAYFRAINYAQMLKQYVSTERNLQLRLKFSPLLRASMREYLEICYSAAMNRYIVLDVRREFVLQDAFEQLRKLEKRYLLKPLKVKLGTEEGEEGVDQGGVSLEFFHVALAQAFNPDNGWFTVDPRTRMAWFQPASLEPLYQFELIGLLFSLAIYNGITIPVTFPKALYRRLLGKPVKTIDDIRDGWPDLAKGLDELLAWSDGDAGDVFLRTYAFSFESLGQRVDVDMEAFGRDDLWPANYAYDVAGVKEWPIESELPPVGSSAWERPERRVDRLLRPNGHRREEDAAATAGAKETEAHQDEAPITNGIYSPSSASSTSSDEASLVTNANRARYVEDYIFWLTDKSIRPQYEAFARGFHACLDKSALQLFTPDALQHLVEGYQDIDIAGLRAVTRYEDGYSAAHPTIAAFWDVVGGYDTRRKRQLLEFVTASDRVPVNGIQSVTFGIVRNGPDTEMLPTSSTCFGKLLLPEYENKEKLERKLGYAIENAKGFGVL